MNICINMIWMYKPTESTCVTLGPRCFFPLCQALAGETMPIPLRMPGPGPPPVRSAMPQPVSYGGTATFQAAVVSLDGSRWECFSPTSENIRSKSGRGSKLNLGSSDSGGCPGGATCNLKKWQQLPCKIRA